MRGLRGSGAARGQADGPAQQAVEEGSAAALERGIQFAEGCGELAERTQLAPQRGWQERVLREEPRDGLAELEAQREGALADRRRRQRALRPREQARGAPIEGGQTVAAQ